MPVSTINSNNLSKTADFAVKILGDKAIALDITPEIAITRNRFGVIILRKDDADKIIISVELPDDEDQDPWFDFVEKLQKSLNDT